jgi:hypothetical protein
MLTPYAALVLSKEIMDNRLRAAERSRVFRSTRTGRKAVRSRPESHEEASHVSR